jgi:hypothetical protein
MEMDLFLLTGGEYRIFFLIEGSIELLFTYNCIYTGLASAYHLEKMRN